MRKQADAIQSFLYSQAFADGFRTTFAILLPALLGAQFGWFETGLAIALGALCVSITDAPGPLQNKRNGMLICAVFLFIVAVVTILVQDHPVALGITIVVMAFFFSMFNVYGARATAVGNAALLVLILTMDKPVPVREAVLHGVAVMSGGIWYFAISYLFYSLRPYRAAQRSLGESLQQIAAYLHIKALFYDPATNLESDYKRLVAQQITVHEKQDAVREILFKTRQIVKESTPQGRQLVYTFVETVDLFEDVTATYYDYAKLRERFASTGLLEKISALITRTANALHHIGRAIHMNTRYVSRDDWDGELAALKTEIDALKKTESESHLVLKKILVNLRRLVQHHHEICRYFGPAPEARSGNRKHHHHFVTHQSLDARIFLDNLTMDSVVFRHALRVAICCLAGFLLAKIISYGHHSYWILLTIAFILKPAFSTTKQRNVERIIGTVCGGLIGFAILYFIKNTTALFILMVLCMILTYSFLRLNYLVMVLFTTPFVLILFHFMGMGFMETIEERIFDTFLGCALALAGGVFLFPSWEKEFLNTHLRAMVLANRDYLKLVQDSLAGTHPNQLRYKLVRKEVYVQSANLSAAFQRMLSEPATKQVKSKPVHQFIVLNHILFSNIATIATSLMRKDPVAHNRELTAPVRKAINLLEKSAGTFGEKIEESPGDGSTTEVSTQADPLLKDQLEYIYHLSRDINRTVTELTAETTEPPAHTPPAPVQK